MNPRELIRNAFLAALAGLLPVLAAGATIASDAQTLGATATLNQRLPAACEFTVPAAGQVQVALTDLVNPVAFTQLRLVVSRGADKVVSLAAPGVQQFAAQPGVHKVQVVGTPGQPVGGDPAGAYDVEVRTVAGNTLLGTCPGGILGATADPSQSILNTTFQIAQAGTYQVTLHDRGFPAALANIDLLLAREGGGGSPVVLGPSCAVAACTLPLTVSAAGTYRLLVFAAAANPHQAGLYSLSVVGPGSATVYATTQPVGRLPVPTDLTLPAAGGYTLSASDLAVPVALAELRVALAQGATQLGTLAAPGSVAVTAVAGSAQLFVFSRAASGAGAGAGIHTVGLVQGAQAIYRDLRTLPDGFDAAVNYGGYRHAFTVATAGEYRLQLRDLNFPGLFGQLRAVLVQNGVAVQNLNGATSGTTVPLAAGPAFLAVLGSPLTANANSLLGLALGPLAGGVALLDQAQGVGPLFATRTVNIPAAGSYDLVINDLNFPAAFAEFAVAVTQGPNLTGQIFGSGQVRFTAQAGTHSINLLARPDAVARYATWGYALTDSPPVPTVTLGATPATVTRDGTVTIAWASTDASTCVATGGWTGTQATSGAANSTALTADTTFTLTCSGAGGSTSRSVTVAVSAPSSGGGGGGGSVGSGAALLLAALLYAVRRQRRADPAESSHTAYLH